MHKVKSPVTESTSKTCDEELESAFKIAIQMREKRIYPFFLAKSLLNHNYRIGYLENVLKAADRYLNRGMADSERVALLKSIEKAKDAESHTAQQVLESFGLE